MKVLITGGCGFLGSNLASHAMTLKHKVYILDNFYRYGSYKNFLWLQKQGYFEFYHADIRNCSDIEGVIITVKPDVIFHLAGQVAMTTSLENPRMDFEVNALGSLNLLESVRKYFPESTIIFSSTNKVYGDLEYLKYTETESRFIATDFPNGFNENIPLDFHSPYGCSKGTADQYMLDYARMFGLKTVVFRHSSMYGGRQYATYDQGWIGWFCEKAFDTRKGLLEEPVTISGNGKQVRDILYYSDLMDCYFSAVKNIDKVRGNVFNIGGGVENSFSLLELFEYLEKILKINFNYTQKGWRKSDQKVFISDNSKAKKLLDWEPKIDKYTGVKNMVKWIDSMKGAN
jgi:CDP-paratose 2-epimerase